MRSCPLMKVKRSLLRRQIMMILVVALGVLSLITMDLVSIKYEA